MDHVADEVPTTAIDRPWNWGATPEEVMARYPCDDWTAGPYRALVRAVDVNAPAGLVFRWLCQLRAAPYSYDWIDNAGRRSPQRLTPDLDRLEKGQRFLIARIASFEAGRHISGVAEDLPRKLFGVLAVTYLVESRGMDTSRIITRLNVEDRPGLWRSVRRTALGWGDLLMMRRQLLNLKRLAERDARAKGSAER
jgi:hypothetical protein